MRELSCWYIIKVGYEGGIDVAQNYSGNISRSKNLSAVLEMLELTGQIRFKISGNKIKVLN